MNDENEEKIYDRTFAHVGFLERKSKSPSQQVQCVELSLEKSAAQILDLLIY